MKLEGLFLKTCVKHQQMFRLKIMSWQTYFTILFHSVPQYDLFSILSILFVLNGGASIEELRQNILKMPADWCVRWYLGGIRMSGTKRNLKLTNIFGDVDLSRSSGLAYWYILKFTQTNHHYETTPQKYTVDSRGSKKGFLWICILPFENAYWWFNCHNFNRARLN